MSSPVNENEDEKEIHTAEPDTSAGIPAGGDDADGDTEVLQEDSAETPGDVEPGVGDEDPSTTQRPRGSIHQTGGREAKTRRQTRAEKEEAEAKIAARATASRNKRKTVAPPKKDDGAPQDEPSLREIVRRLVRKRLRETFLDDISNLLSEYAELYETTDVKKNLEGLVRYEFSREVDDTKPYVPQFETVYDFVDEFLIFQYPTTLIRESNVRWTEHWTRHPEAVSRLTALWQRYEQLRRDEPQTYLETFLRFYGDYHMRIIMAPASVFDDAAREDTPSVPLKSAPLVGVKTDVVSQPEPDVNGDGDDDGGQQPEEYQPEQEDE